MHNPHPHSHAALDFYFDFSSPYGYFGSLEIDKLAARHQRHVNWHPILLGPVFKALGTHPLATIPVKGDYSMHDMLRTARFHKIPFRLPSRFPLGTQVAARAMLWLQQHHPELAVPFAQAIYSAYFTDDIDISEATKVLTIAATLGVDRDVLESALGEAAIKDQLKQATEDALNKGVFGSPFVIADGEPFWGFDRYVQLDAFLNNGKI